MPEGFDPTTTVFVTAVGAPDADRLRPDSFLKKDKKDKDGNIIKPAGSAGYYKTWGRDQTPMTADQHGYVVVIPEIHKSIKIGGKEYDVSHGTECRNLWNAIRDNARARKEFLTQMYARPSQELGAIFDKIPESANEDIAQTDSNYSSSPISGARVFHEEAAGVGVIASKKQAKDPRYSMSLTQDVRPGQVEKNLKAFRLAEGDHSVTEEDMMEMVKEFLPVAMKELKVERLPKIILQKYVTPHDGQATFGRFVNEEETIYLGIADRHPVDILRTLAHELVHFKQYEDGKMYPGAGETGSPIENEAHWVAGIIMRHFNKKYPKAIKSKPLELDESKQEKCPPATQDIALNLKNRQKAIDEYGYGPLNPDLPNTKFWMKKVDEWNLDSVEEAKQSLCGNCAAFDQRKDTLDCIAQGIDSDSPQDAEAVIDAGDLGYCKFLKFKCASRRTCDAWVTGGPLTDQVDENLRDWFKEKWVRFGPDGKIRGDCARGDDREGKPKCLPQAKAHALGKKGRASAAARKRREDPNPERHGAAINVATKKKSNEELCPECGGPMFSELLINEKKDACYYKVKSRYKVWPSAYASGALVKCRKKGAANWGNKSESVEEPLDEKWSEKYKRSIDCSHPKGFSQKAHCAGRKKNEDRHPNDTPYGPEFKPTMPQGTVRVDVSDVYDWYKLGQHISNLKGLGKHDFGKGPPSTIMAFGSEEEEHKYIKDLLKTGLTTTDIDPPSPIKGPKQKVDPTFNVGENFADGRNPQDKGDSKRHGVPTKASVSDLRKFAKSHSGRAAQLAHWMANMKSGRKKKK